MAQPYPPQPDAPPPFHARALLLGSRIDVRVLERGDPVALAPLTLRVGERGHAVVFRFGAVVFFDLSPAEERRFLAELEPHVRSPFREREVEEIEIRVDPARSERLGPDGVLVLYAPSLERLQVVADVLAKSTVLAHYEERVALVFDRIERLASDLHRGARPARGRDLTREIGDVLLIQTQTVGRAEITEKPEITWDEPDLDRLYERLAVEYELRERDVALARKLDLVSTTAETYLNLLHDRASIRVEWYIVLLIMVEIVLILYDIFLARGVHAG